MSHIRVLTGEVAALGVTAAWWETSAVDCGTLDDGPLVRLGLV